MYSTVLDLVCETIPKTFSKKLWEPGPTGHRVAPIQGAKAGHTKYWLLSYTFCIFIVNFDLEIFVFFFDTCLMIVPGL